jgi:ureidoglycolate hydrolase
LEIKNENGSTIITFKEKEEAGVSYFKNLFFEPISCLIQEILEVVGKFAIVFYKEMNEYLKEEVMEEELCSALSSKQNGKILGPDGLQ